MVGRWIDGTLPPVAYIGANMLTLEPFYRTVLGKAPTTVAAWSPSDDADCVLWLAASNVNDTTEGRYVTTWTDNSGQSNDLTQTSESLQPTYEVVGSIPVVRFDGSDKLIAASAVIDLTKTMSWFIVMSNRIVHLSEIMGTLSGANGRSLWFRATTEQKIAVFVDSSGYDYPNTGIADDTLATYSADILSYSTVAGEISIRVNGVGVTPNATKTGSSTNDGNFAVGSTPTGSYALDGDIADIICFSREADADLYTNVSAYWSATYGL